MRERAEFYVYFCKLRMSERADTVCVPALSFILLRTGAANKARDTLSSRLFSWSHTQTLNIKRKTKRKRAGAAQAASAFSFFACLRGKPNPLRCCFPLFPRRVARERTMAFPRKFTPFRLRCAPCGTVVPLKVTLGKSVILPRSITLYSMCPQHLNVCEAPLCGCMSKHFTRSFVAQRIKSAFHVFALAKTFHFCAAIYVRLPLTYICAKISRSERRGTLSFIDFAVPRRRFLDFFPHCI